MTNLLFETKLSEQQRAFAEVVQNSANSLLELLNNAMVHTRLADGPIQLEQVDFDLHSLLEDAVAHFAPQAMRKGIEIASIIPADVPTVICGDPVRLQQALSTLLSNAVKFTDHGEISLSVKLVGEEKDGVILNFEVIDTGIGISEAEHGNVLKAFSTYGVGESRGNSAGTSDLPPDRFGSGRFTQFSQPSWRRLHVLGGDEVRSARSADAGGPDGPGVKGKVVRIDVRSAVLQRSLLNYCVAMGLQPAANQTITADLAIVDSDSKQMNVPRILISAEPTGQNGCVTKPVRYAELSRAAIHALAGETVTAP